MKIAVRVMPKKEVLDTQGRAVEHTLRASGRELKSCTVGRYIVLDLPEMSRDQAITKVKDMAEYVLYNPLIESYEIETLDAK